MIDTLYANLDRALASDVLHRHGLTPGEYALATLHRPANVDSPSMLAGLIQALESVAQHLPVVLPVHPRTAARLPDASGLRLIPPAGYLDFIALQASARLVLTDSGGIQEETTALGVPCLTLRDSTERPITLTEGTNILVGRDPTRIVETARRVLSDPPPKRTPALWDGHAGDRIAEALLHYLASPNRLRPTDARTVTV
jgi:UDP-N-acetylglucosamine 2-epimerase (non-hydrolysing)